jgi:NAD(P)-dependent dehydrogenase (short-subunit alcohol dehydrogenase family)
MTVYEEGAHPLPPESLGEAPAHGRMAGRRVVVLGAGQTDYGLDEQPVGNGRAISLLLAREGAKVAAIDRDDAAARGTAELITGAGGEATAVVADVAEPAAVEDAITRSHQWMGGIDGIVYNVGIPGAKGWEANTAEAFDATMSVNLRGAMLACRAALPIMDAGSSCVLVSSIASQRPTGQILAYEASKAAMGALMRAVAFEGRERAIRANIVMLGLIDTGLGRSANESQHRKAIPVALGRQGTAWEVAYAALFLLSNESAYITGQTLAVDGGRTTL